MAKELVAIISSMDADNGFNFLAWADGNGPPRIFERDKYDTRLRGYEKPLAFYSTFEDAVHHFKRDGKPVPNAGPSQVAVALLPEFGFKQKEIAAAMEQAATDSEPIPLMTSGSNEPDDPWRNMRRLGGLVRILRQNPLLIWLAGFMCLLACFFGFLSGGFEGAKIGVEAGAKAGIKRGAELQQKADTDAIKKELTENPGWYGGKK
jgi:hypothetical protein